MQPNLNELITWAVQAGEILRASYGKRHQVTHKGVIDLVTEADKNSETYLLGEIQRNYPGHTIISEEAGRLDGQDGHCWYIDPLDGTINYAHGVPLFAVSAAYAAGGQVQLGVVVDPMRNEVFSAERGRGAWLNGEPLHISSIQDLQNALLVTGFPYNMWTTAQENLVNFKRFSIRTQGVRRLGSAALDMAYVAAGRLDGYWEHKVETWDVAAGVLLVREAGGVVTRLDGSGNPLDEPVQVLAANPGMHAKMVEVINNGAD